jgi:hypothetical protein
MLNNEPKTTTEKSQPQKEPAVQQRIIDAPSWEWGTAQECSEFLGVTKDAFLARVEAGQIPPGIKWNRVNIVWKWDVIYAVSVLSSWLLKKQPDDVKQHSTSDLVDLPAV